MAGPIYINRLRFPISNWWLCEIRVTYLIYLLIFKHYLFIPFNVLPYVLTVGCKGHTHAHTHDPTCKCRCKFHSKSVNLYACFWWRIRFLWLCHFDFGFIKSFFKFAEGKESFFSEIPELAWNINVSIKKSKPLSNLSVEIFVLCITC